MKRDIFIVIFDNALEHFEISLTERESLISLKETEESLCEGTFGALSARNLFHFRFSSAQSLRAHSLNSSGQHTYNWLYNRIETDRQPSLEDSYQRQISLGGEPPNLTIFNRSSD